MRIRGAVLVLALLTGAACPPFAWGGDRKLYLEDLEFLDQTVRQHAAALKSKSIDWKAAVARFRPRFASALDDRDHVRNIMGLLAVLRDSHSDVWRTSVTGLPSKWEGAFGGGLWFGWEQGKFILRGVTDDHPLQASVALGSVLVGIGKEPAWLAMARVRSRIAGFSGISSDHSLFTSMSNRLLPFGELQRLELTFLDPEGNLRRGGTARFAPSGKSFSPSDLELPDGMQSAPGAVACRLESIPDAKLGYLRITGSMNAATAQAFHQALEPLRELDGLLLDCRWMGGGSDDSAWEMAGRFYSEGVNNGRNGRIEASGDWQFGGPIVMLQNEAEISSAETFTWAMSEPGRVISVGRNTGGWAIIPRVFDCPSGLASVRIGVTDRLTPIKGLRTEGTGWPPDVSVPYGPVFCAEADPVREVGVEILSLLSAGCDQEQVRADYHGLFEGEVQQFQKSAVRYQKQVKRYQPDRIANKVLDDLAVELKLEVLLLQQEGAATPDALGAEARKLRLLSRGKAAGLKSETALLARAVKSARADAQAQQAFLDLVGDDWADPAPRDRKQFLSRHGQSKLGRWLREELWD